MLLTVQAVPRLCRDILSRRASTARPAKSFATVSASELKFGQPLPDTHPHLLQPGELTPGITAFEYHCRRAALAKKLPRHSIAILPSATVKYRSGSVFYEYRQESNFSYLTGFGEPESLAVIEKGDTDVEYTFHLFVRPKSARTEQWEGPRSGVQAARDVFNADESASIDSLDHFLPRLIDRAKEVYTDVGVGKRKSQLEGFLSSSSDGTTGLAKVLSQKKSMPLGPLMNDLRVVKSEAELNCMRKAGHISGAVISEVMRNAYTRESEIWNDLAYGYRTQGLSGEAYIPVIGGGTNALCIHYVKNNALLAEGDVVLVDSGGEYGGYISDITRTWPVNGHFTSAQRDMYNMILQVQEKCIDLCREDSGVSLDSLHRICEQDLLLGLKDLGFDVSGNALGVLFPHHLGHYIGLDVHDAPGFPRATTLQTGHCITIEPGIYVPDDPRWPKHFRGLGIRIEDSVCVGKDRAEILTHTAAKSVEQIQRLRVA